MVGAFFPSHAQAGMLGDMIAFLSGGAEITSAAPAASGSLQTMPLPKPATNIDPTPARGGGSITIVDNSALLPQEGPSGTIADIDRPKNSTISRYVVKPGDTISSIATLFDVSQGTVLAANDLKKGAKLKPGQVLIILPVTGIKYTMKSGDTLASIAKRFGGDVAEIASYNGLDEATVAVGDQIIVPNGEVPASPGTAPTSKSTVKSSRSVGQYIAPLARYTRTQGIHGYNGIDMGAPAGTPVLAAAGGEVVVAREGGWNGGYGSYVVITHDNGSQTLYSHMSQVSVYDGQRVAQGHVVGYVGSTGHSTGPHLHFEIRNGIRNPF